MRRTIHAHTHKGIGTGVRIDRSAFAIPFTRSRLLHVLIASGALSIAPGVAHADENDPQSGNTPGNNAAAQKGTGKTSSDGGAQQAQVATVVVHAKKESRVDAVKDKLADIPGGTSVIDNTAVGQASVQTNADVLSLQPGVFAQSAGGTDGLKISIRGSNIQSGTNYFRTGILFSFDGLPVTGPGGTPYELFEPLGLAYTEVLRGANAFDAGALELGGAINYVTKTGYDAAPFQARFEAGSFGYTKEQISSGAVIGNFDYYASITNSYRAGYQVNSATKATGVVANFGYQFTSDLSTRLYIRYRRTNLDYPGSLTNAQIAANPRQAQYPYYTDQYHSYRLQPGSVWIADETTYKIDSNSQIVGGFVYHNYPIEIGEGANWGIWGFTDISGVLQYKRVDTIAGRESDTQIGVLATRNLNGWQDTVVRIPTGATANVPVGETIRRAEYGGQDITFHASNNTEIVPRWWLTTGLAFANSQRSTQVVFPQTQYPGVSRSTWNFSPRIGLKFELTPDISIYGNVSRGAEAPMSWEFLSGTNFATGVTKGLAAGTVDLQDETATTFELGTTGTISNNKWTLAIYRSNVSNELLDVNTGTIANPLVSYYNSSPTIHQGVEASLETQLFARPGYAVTYRQAYTLSDFHYKHDPVFNNNRLPGLPVHYYQGQLRVDTTLGFYAAANVTASSSVWDDYANTTETPGYTVFGATLGWENKSWSTFLNFTNLTNKHYANTVSPTYNNNHVDTAQLTPGDGFGVFAGVEYSWR